MKLDILVVTAHPDDAEIGVGGTLLDHAARGDDVTILTLSRGAESNTDHAAKWETSNMMFLYPDLVDLAALGDGPLAPNMKAPDGIGGLDPREHASATIGRRNVELAAAAIGRKARELLESVKGILQPPIISPEHWWMI